jgi:uncharacterized membrane protein YhaH (DUF805 family)
MLIIVPTILVVSYFSHGKKNLIGLHGMSGRRGRLSYLMATGLWTVELIVLTFATLLMVDYWAQSSSVPTDIYQEIHFSFGKLSFVEFVKILFLAALYIYECIFIALVSAQRCRDFGWTGWSVLLSFLPVVGILFSLAIFFVPGNLGANRYGPDPIS